MVPAVLAALVVPVAPVVLAVHLRVVHPAAKSLLADLVERPVVLLAILVVLLAVLVVLLRVLHPAALAVPEVCPICSAAPLRKPFLR